MRLDKLSLVMGVLSAVLLASACVGADVREAAAAGAGERPAWLLNPPSKAGHIYGAGSAEIFAGEAEAMERARDQARLAIVRQFAEVEVSGSIESRESLSNRDGSESYHSEVENLARSRVKPVKLKHDSFVEQFRDGRWVHVLGDLDVGREKMDLRRRRDELDDEIARSARFLGEEAPARNPDIHDIRRLTPALVSMHERAELQARINALAPSQREPLNSDEQRHFKERLMELIAALRVSITPSNGRADASLRSGLGSRLTERGMRLQESGGDLRVIYDLESNERGRDGVYFVTTRGRVSVEDQQGREIAAFRASAKGSSSDAVTARERSLDKLADKLGEQLTATLLP